MLSFKKAYTLPFKFEIPSYIDQFLDRRLWIKSSLKLFKRYLYMAINGQNSLEIFNISENHKNILWINFSAPSLGDSLMDLSSRVLLTDKKIDLLTDKKNAILYKDDVIFSSVFTENEKVISRNYDLIIIDSYSTRSIKIKTEVAKHISFLGMYGYFNGPEVNRVLFSFHQMNNLLGYPKTENEINKLAKCLISISNQDLNIIKKFDLPSNFITIIIGGEWQHRTYKNWRSVIKQLLIKNENLKIVLLGSINAKDDEIEIINNFKSPRLISFVAKLTFNQTAQIISQTKILFCCDGGLLHAANAFEVKIIPLFARLQPKMQLTQSSRVFPLFDEVDVNRILAEDILIKYCDAIKLDYNHLQNE